MPRILVLGAGFAGLWAAIGAARKLEEIGSRAREVEVLVVDRNPILQAPPQYGAAAATSLEAPGSLTRGTGAARP